MPISPATREAVVTGARLFRGLADPTRLAVLWSLAEGVFYRISSPEVLGLLAAAERVLEAHGRRVRLCPRLAARRRAPAAR